MLSPMFEKDLALWYSVPAAAPAPGCFICPQAHPTDFTSCISPPHISSSPRNLCWFHLHLEDPKHSLTASGDPQSPFGSRGWSKSTRSTRHPMSSDPGWQDVVELGWPHTAKSCPGVNIRYISICISPGCRRAPGLSAGWLIYCPGREWSGQRYGIRALSPAVNSRVAQGRAGARRAPCDNPQPAQLKKYARHLALSSRLGLWAGMPAPHSRCLPAQPELDPYTNTQWRPERSCARDEFGPVVQSSSRSCLQPRLWGPHQPRPCLHLASFQLLPPARPCITILSCLVLWRRHALQLRSPGRSLCPLLSPSSPTERLMEMLGLAGLLRAGCIHPTCAVMGKLPGNF